MTVQKLKAIVVDRLTIETCRNNPGVIYVFGDNLVQRGKAGQAVIRDEPNAAGVPTKRLPTMAEDAFFGDRVDETVAVVLSIVYLRDAAKTGKIVAFPRAGLGTGLAQMRDRSPVLFDAMNWMISEIFNVHYDPRRGYHQIDNQPD